MTARPIQFSARGTQPFTPELFKINGKEDVPENKWPVFSLTIPTFATRDNLSSLLFSQGCIPVTREHGRAVLISELYDVYDPDPNRDPRIVPTKVEVLDDNGEGTGKFEMRDVEVPWQVGDPDEIAGFLEGHWQQAELYEEVISMWALQERERLLDQVQGAPKRDGVPMPAAPYTPRDSHRAKRIAMEMLEWSQPYRDVQSRYADYDTREDLMLFRIFVAGWSGMDTRPARDATGKLSIDCVEALRGEMTRQGRGDAYIDIVREVRQNMTMDRETEKNFASPLDGNSSPSGLTAENDGSDITGGSSTALPTGPIPEAGSRPTSSTSLSSPSKPAGRKKATPTAKA